MARFFKFLFGGWGRKRLDYTALLLNDLGLRR